MENDDPITERLSIIREAVKRLKKLKNDKDIDDEDKFAIAEHYMRRSSEALLDICRHIAVREKLRRPKEYRESILALGKKGILPQKFAEEIQHIAGFRNRLVHNYEEIDPEELFKIVRERLRDFELFEGYIGKYLERHGKK